TSTTFAGKRDSFSPALGLGLLSQLHLVVLLKPSRRCSNDAHLHIAASRPDDRIGLLAAAHESVFGRLCCKTLLSISARKIDSRSGANTQQRFKRTGAPILLFQISISQSLLGDFCNTIGPKAKSAERVAMSASAPQSGLIMLNASSSPFDRYCRKSHRVI